MPTAGEDGVQRLHLLLGREDRAAHEALHVGLRGDELVEAGEVGRHGVDRVRRPAPARTARWHNAPRHLKRSCSLEPPAVSRMPRCFATRRRTRLNASKTRDRHHREWNRAPASKVVRAQAQTRHGRGPEGGRELACVSGLRNPTAAAKGADFWTGRRHAAIAPPKLTESSSGRRPPTPSYSPSASARGSATAADRPAGRTRARVFTRRRKRWRPRTTAIGASAGPSTITSAWRARRRGPARAPMTSAARRSAARDDQRREPAEGRQAGRLAAGGSPRRRSARRRPRAAPSSRGGRAGRSAAGRGPPCRRARRGPSPAAGSGRCAPPRAGRPRRGRDRRRPRRPATGTGNCGPWRRAACR